jgi:hypothetical protein
MITLVLGSGIQCSFCKGFSASCKNVRTVLGLKFVGVQHLFFCLLTIGWKYDLCRYQFVVKTFFISFTSIFYVVLLFVSPFYTYTICPFPDISYMIIRAIPEYKPLHMPNISKHIYNILTPKNGTPAQPLQDKKRTAPQKATTLNFTYR